MAGKAELRFSLCYVPPTTGTPGTRGRLIITNIIARNLNANSDPYVKLSLMYDGGRLETKRTSTKWNNSGTIVYNSLIIVFDVPDSNSPTFNINQMSLRIAVMDTKGDDGIDDEVMGVFRVGSSTSHLGQEYWSEMLANPPRPIAPRWHPLEDNVAELGFSLCYVPRTTTGTTGTLTIKIIKASNLNANSDPYVKVSLMCEGRILKTKKTSTKRNKLNPVYNKVIVFDVPDSNSPTFNINQMSLRIAVMDTKGDDGIDDEVMGVFRVGSSTSRLGQAYWREMRDNSPNPIEPRWHTLNQELSEAEMALYTLVTGFHRASGNNTATLTSAQFESLATGWPQLPTIAEANVLLAKEKLELLERDESVSFETFWTLVKCRANVLRPVPQGWIGRAYRAFSCGPRR